MSVIGIVCEFNPFHNGHKFLIDSVKKQGDVVVCVMSGNFVQRCEPAIFPKEDRVRAALMNGADIVLELPFLYATASAEIFAYNSVKILDSFGCDKIAFGTENLSYSEINEIVSALNDDDFEKRIKEYLEKGNSYPVARQLALREYNEKFDISLPNNILAIEYVKALRKLNSNIDVVCVNRVGAGYNDDFAIDCFASATHIRSLINNNQVYKDYIPENVQTLYDECITEGRMILMEKYNIASLALLRSKLHLKSESIAYMAEGLENRINEAVKDSNCLCDIYDKAKTKRYTHSRIRRAVLCRQFDITAEDIQIEIPYCRLLGFNKNCSGIMGELVKKCNLPFITRYSDVEKMNEHVQYVFSFEEKSTDIYNLSLKKSDVCAKERSFSPLKI